MKNTNLIKSYCWDGNIVHTQIYDFIYFVYFKEYNRLEREIKSNWSDQPSSQQQQHQPQTASIVLSSAAAFTEKSSNTH